MRRGGRARRILVVDDQPANVRALAAVLEEAHEILFATDGATALRLAAERPVDLVLLDVEMPGLDGFEVCRRLKADERTERVPVIFVTASDQVDDEERGFEAGGVDYITKPISPPIVRARVRTHLELKENRDLLEELASIDGLTGVANRRRLDQALAREWRRAVRSGDWLSVILVDIDHFKQYNDRYGHPRGDDTLRAVAAALGDVERRPGDLVARYGGEEFAVALPGTDPAGALALARDLFRHVHRLAIEHQGSPSGDRLTLSAGMVSERPARVEEEAEAAVEATVETVDRLLYRAKEGGRNRGVHLDLVAGVETIIQGEEGA